MMQITLTPNNRIASTLIQHELEKSHSNVSEDMSIYSVSEFIESQYIKLQRLAYKLAQQPLMNTDLIYLLFLDHVGKAPVDALADRYEFATACYNAFIQCKHSCVSFSEIIPQNVDHQYFLTMVKRVENDIEGLGYMFEYDAALCLAKALKDGDIEPFDFNLYAFDDIQPYIERLLEENLNAGGSSTHDAFKLPKGENTCFFKKPVFNDNEQLEVAATIALNTYRSNPMQTVAIVHPSLHEPGAASKFKRVLREKFEPQYILASTPQYTEPFNFTMGESLSNVPLVQCALNILALGTSTDEISAVVNLLKSPFLNSYDLIKNEKLVNYIHELGVINIDVVELARRIECSPTLSTQLTQFKSLIKCMPPAAHMSEWSEIFIQLLQIFGWAEGRKLNSEEYQAYECFKAAIDELAKSDDFFGPTSFNTAKSVFMRLCNKTVFHPETSDSPIHIMGTLEAAGLNFDTVIMLNMDNITYPSKPSPSPMLPIQCQIENDMPHCNAERELIFADKIVKRISRSAKKTFFLYCEQVAGVKREKSVYFHGVDIPDKYLLNTGVEYSKSEFKRIPIIMKDEPPIPLKSNYIKGGVSTIDSTMQCPVKGFVKSRLNINESIRNNQGLSHFEKGNILHRALEYIWTELKTHKSLISAAPRKVDNLVHESIKVGFFELKRSHLLPGKLIEIETEYLSEVLIAWLHYEMKRTPFIVYETEKTIDLNILNHILKIRIDRQDLVFNGETFDAQAVIDYKKGNPKLSEISGRITSSQLPLVAAFVEGTESIAYGKVNKNTLGLSGYQNADNEPCLLTVSNAGRAALPNSWGECVAYWRESIEKVVQAIIDSSMELTPFNKNECLTCNEHAVCKINSF